MTSDDIYKTLLTFGRQRILQNFKLDSCIASTRITIAVLKRFGIKAHPQSCKIYIATLPLFERLQAGNFCGKFLPGEHSVGIGYGSPVGIQPGFDGHLVAIAEDHLIDLSLDQASRPHKGIVLGPHRVSGKLSEWQRKRKPGGATIRTAKFWFSLIFRKPSCSSARSMRPGREMPSASMTQATI